MRDVNTVIYDDLNYILSNLKIEFLKLSGKKLLITGGAGFLGYYLIKSILFWNKKNPDKSPINLKVYDNFLRGTPKWFDEYKLNENFSFENYNIINPIPNSLGQIDFIIHAASIASPTFYRKYPIETMDANVTGLRNLLNYSIDLKSKKLPLSGFLFFSTSEIYGDPLPENIPTSEDYRGNVSCTGPRACYDESKRYGETMCVNFAKQYDLPISIARPFNNYGPGLKLTDKRALPDFVNNILQDRDVVLFSDGSPTRTFCYIADAIIGYLKILTMGNRGVSYNIGTEKPEISMKNLALTTIQIAKELFSYQGKLVFKDSEDSEYLIDNPNRRCPSIKKAYDELGYNPIISLEDGLKRSLIWYFNNRDIEEE